MSDELLANIVSTPVSNIEEVIIVMSAINELLANEDGLKWFNFLYLKVTEKILENPPAEGWESPGWLARLDVIFAGLYFEAIRKWISQPSSAPESWQVLLNSRHRQNIMRVQFALCGMNAHINRDLQLALVLTGQELGIKPGQNTPQHRDFERVNNILELAEAEVLPIIATGIIGTIEESLGKLDNILSFWGVKAARETAWLNSQLFWLVRNNSFLLNAKMRATDKITGALGRALIVSVS